MIFDDFLMRAALAGILVALVAAPLGAFVVWRRMAYLGAAIAHSSLLGVAFAVFLGVHLVLGVTLISFLLAVSFLLLERQKFVPADTLLGILAHVSLAGGLVLAQYFGLRTDLDSLLFGDILTVTREDLALMALGGGGVLGVLIWLWRPLLAVSVHQDLAQVEGVPVERVRLAFLALISVTIALSMKVVGILLIASLLVLPASAARPFSKSPEHMAFGSIFFAVTAVLLGLLVSASFDVMTGPAIVLVLALMFLLSLLIRSFIRA